MDIPKRIREYKQTATSETKNKYMKTVREIIKELDELETLILCGNATQNDTLKVLESVIEDLREHEN